jgi:ketosteroid isomerase-like protein
MITKPASEIVSEVTALSKRYCSAYLTKDTKGLEKILADDWTLITAGCGDRVSKRDQLRDLSDGTLQVRSIEDSDVNVRLAGNAAIVTGKRASNVTYNGRDVSDLALFTQIYVIGDEGWRCVSSQVTSIRPDPDRVVRALSNQYARAYLTKDINSLDRILSDDWTLITAGCGDRVSKRDQLKDLADGKLQVHGIEDSDVIVRFFGNAAVVTGKRASKVTYNGRDVSDLALFTQFYVAVDEGWRCVSTQVTSLRPQQGRAPGRA